MLKLIILIYLSTNLARTIVILYIDKNSLYPEAMSDFLPYADFKLENPENFDFHSILDLSYESEKGYIFEVDLEYPLDLHEQHMTAQKTNFHRIMISIPMLRRKN